MKKKLITLGCVFVLLASTIAGCGSNKKGAQESGGATGTDQSGGTANQEMVELTIGAMNFKDSEDEEVWPTTIVEELEKKMGVKIRIVGYDEERLNLDLASGQLCDIMMIYPKHLDGVLKGGHALSLETYLDSTATHIGSEKMQLRNEIMRQYRSNGSNNLYFTTPAVADEGIGEAGPLLGLGYAVRWDLYKEIGAPDINSGDDYIDAMIQMKALYPETEDGLPVYVTSAYNEMNTHAWTMRGLLDKGFATLDGNSNYTIDVQSNEIAHNVYGDSSDTPFWSDMKFYNRMYQEGLLDPDCFITKGEDMIDKYAKGQYIGGVTSWHYTKWNNAVAAQDAETTKGFVILPSYMGWTNSVYQGGWADKMFFVSSGSKNKEKAVEVLDYFSSTEFARLEESGVEGVNWTVNAEGIPELTEDTIDMKSNPTRIDEWKKLGLTTMVEVAGNARNSICEDGYPASLWDTPEVWASTLNSTERDFCKTMGLEYPRQLLTKKIEAGTNIDQRNFNTLATICMPTAPKDITRIDNNCLEIILNALPSIVQAENAEAFDKAQKQLIENLEKADIQTALDWWTTNWNESLKVVEAMSK